MKHYIFYIYLLGAILITLHHSQEPSPPQENASLINPTKIREAISQAELYLTKKQNFEAYLILQDLEIILQKNNADYPQVYLLLGIIHMSKELRDVNKALEYFDLYKSKTYTSISVEFNIAECHFINHNFEKSAQCFEILIDTYKTKIPQTFLSISNFKLYCCYLKLNQLEKAQKLMDQKFSLYGDDPNFYFAKFIHHMLQQQYLEAREWSSRAAYIYSAHEISSYNDIFEEINLYETKVTK
jgi:tetratricopeptide (TPR) repeat protein